ncbi:MAG: ribbon-helix-helix protein, CopG family [Burkholderiales bacterium]|nr:ribbon-helix-helix protein, CopG family [Burkholderiales bacterium]
MANLTITVDDDLLKRARLKALAQGSSVNAVLRQFLEQFAGADEARQAAIDDVLALSRASKANSQGRRWTRDELHERR